MEKIYVLYLSDLISGKWNKASEEFKEILKEHSKDIESYLIQIYEQTKNAFIYNKDNYFLLSTSIKFNDDLKVAELLNSILSNLLYNLGFNYLMLNLKENDNKEIKTTDVSTKEQKTDNNTN